MNIYITTPALTPNGGIRVILEVAHRLSKFHNVTIYNESTINSCHWYPIECQIVNDTKGLGQADILIISSPHSMHLTELKIKARVFAFNQMMEHLFQPNNRAFRMRCFQFYNLETITISQWGINELRTFGNLKPIHYLGNGVNLDHFPIYSNKKDGKTILLESPEPINPTKDRDRIALKVALRLKNEGYRVIGYGVVKPKGVDSFFVNPDLNTLNALYKEATILIKATLYDFRSTSPMEAGTKGTVTARAIIKGDDDLINEFNCLRVNYSEADLYTISKRLLEDEKLRTRLAKNMIAHIKENNWDKYIDQFNKIICG
jgi:hypothetical protein